MRKLLLTAAALALGSSVLAAQKDDVPVTITACVHEGNNGTFVLTNVVDLSESKDAPAEAVYWLSTTKGLKDHIGHRIEVAGTYSPSRDAGKTAMVKIETDAEDGETTVAVENGMKRAEFHEPVPVGTSGVVGDSTVEIVKPYRRLEVTSLRMIGASCS